MKKFVKLSNRKTIRTWWLSELGNTYENAWRFGEYMIRQIKKKNPVDAEQKIGYILDMLWEKYPLF